MIKKIDFKITTSDLSHEGDTYSVVDGLLFEHKIGDEFVPFVFHSGRITHYPSGFIAAYVDGPVGRSYMSKIAVCRKVLDKSIERYTAHKMLDVFSKAKVINEPIDLEGSR